MEPDFNIARVCSFDDRSEHLRDRSVSAESGFVCASIVDLAAGLSQGTFSQLPIGAPRSAPTTETHSGKVR
ncbi:hypothetical protein ACWEOI_15470 [Nocardia sp. NPDC004340]|uniref:hypothetical protein n=1 Tax=Nocardia sp. CA-136227 TaxID=3239979 RepID=UPI003D987828